MAKTIIPLLIISLLFLSGCTQRDDIFLVNKDSFKEYSETIKYEDLRFPVSAIQVQGAANLPKWAVFINNTISLYFSPSTMNQAYITAQLPHARIINTTISPHFHWTYDEPKAFGDVVWCLEYTCADVGDIYPLTQIECVTDTAGLPYEHHMTNMIHIDNNLSESAVCNIRIFRDTENPGDTLPVEVSLQEFDIHYMSYQYGEELH